MSTENDFYCKKINMLKVLKYVKTHADKTAKSNQDCIDKTTELQYANISLEKKKILLSYGLEISQELKILKEKEKDILPYLSNIPESSKPREILAEIYEEYFYEQRVINYAVKALSSILEACKYGSLCVSLKLLPKLFNLLEYEDVKGAEYIVNGLPHDIFIKRSFFLPFLPFLISQLKHSVKELNNMLLKILMHIGIKYPQHVFFALEHLRFTETTLSGGDKERESNSDKIVDALSRVHPRLINQFKEIVKLIDGCKPIHNSEDSLTIFNKLLDKAYSCVFQNVLKKDDSTSIFSSFEAVLNNPLIAQVLEANHCLNPVVLESLKCYSPKKIIKLLKKDIRKVSQQCAKYQEEERYNIYSKLLLLSSAVFQNEENIYVFGQSALVCVDCSSYVKIHKFIPEIERVYLNKRFFNKIEFLGHDGKVYSFLMENDFLSRKKTLETIKLNQLLENLNPLLNENATCSKRFLKFHFPRITLMGRHIIFVPYHNYVLYSDLFQKYAREYFSKDKYFSELLECNDASSEENFAKQLFDSLVTKESEDILIIYVKTILETPMDYLGFIQQFLRHISMLVSSIYFFRIYTKEMLIGKSSGIVTTQCMEFRLDQPFIAGLNCLTPDIKKFVGPLGIKIISKNVTAFANFLKDNQRLIGSLLNLIKKGYSEEKIKEFVSIVEKNLSVTSAEIIEEKLSSGSHSDFLEYVDPLVHPWF